MQRPMSVCRPIGIDILLRRPNRFEQCLTEGSEEDFEQKAAKETKGLGFCDGHPVGSSATLRFSNRPRGLIGAAKCSGLCRCAGQSGSILLCRPNRFEQCSTEGSEEDLNRRQQRKQRGWVSVMVIRRGLRRLRFSNRPPHEHLEDLLGRRLSSNCVQSSG
jgi:hypothetical protein